MNEENLEPVCKSIMECLQELKQEGPREEELAQTLSQIRSELLLSMENTHNRMHNNARNLLYMGRIVTIEETLEALRAVSRMDIMDYMEKYCRPDQVSMTLVGDVEKNPTLKKIFESL